MVSYEVRTVLLYCVAGRSQWEDHNGRYWEFGLALNLCKLDLADWCG